MKRRDAILVPLALGAVGAQFSVLAQALRANSARKIGTLELGVEEATPGPRRPLSVALRKMGWIEGENLTIERRYAEFKHERLAEFAEELVRKRVDVILAIGDNAAVAAFNATRSIPIVMAAAAPVELGLAKSFASPGGNVTGVVYQALDYSGKELDLLRAIQPGLKQMGIVFSDTVVARAWYAGWQAAADRAGVTMVKLPWPARVVDIEATLVAAKGERVQAIQFGLHHGLRGAGWQQITAWAISNKVLTASADRPCST